VRLVSLADPLVTDELAHDWVVQTIEDLREHMEEIGEL
jgi:hypothetical protein